MTTSPHTPGYPYPENDGGTHFTGCWRARGHHNCAVAEVERLRALVDASAVAGTSTFRVDIYASGVTVTGPTGREEDMARTVGGILSATMLIAADIARSGAP